MSDVLKSYASPWDGRLILACKKCQKKMKSHKDNKSLAKLKKAINKNETRHNQEINVLNVPCMKVCPKHGVAVIDPDRSGGKLYILREKEDVNSLMAALSRP